MTPHQQVRNVLSVTNDFSGSFMQWIKYVGNQTIEKIFTIFHSSKETTFFLL